MSRTTDQHELLEKFKKIINVSQRIKRVKVARYLGISELDLVSLIADLENELPVKINADYIIVEDFDDFVAYTDQLFGSWAEMENSKVGKLDIMLGSGDANEKAIKSSVLFDSDSERTIIAK
ncbi:MAG: hypothetical protein ACTSWN_11885 [Promethearchaeota archaeon]